MSFVLAHTHFPMSFPFNQKNISYQTEVTGFSSEPVELIKEMNDKLDALLDLHLGDRAKEAREALQKGFRHPLRSGAVVCPILVDNVFCGYTHLIESDFSTPFYVESYQVMECKNGKNMEDS